MGYQIFALTPTDLCQIISDFHEHTHPPNCGISYVDGPLRKSSKNKFLLQQNVEKAQKNEKNFMVQY